MPIYSSTLLLTYFRAVLCSENILIASLTNRAESDIVIGRAVLVMGATQRIQQHLEALNSCVFTAFINYITSFTYITLYSLYIVSKNMYIYDHDSQNFIKDFISFSYITSDVHVIYRSSSSSESIVLVIISIESVGSVSHQICNGTSSQSSALFCTF